jgi:hypothetical protein
MKSALKDLIESLERDTWKGKQDADARAASPENRITTEPPGPQVSCSTTPLAESTEPIVPTRADCGCSGLVCPRCWLCAEHCRCLPMGTCWHCRGEGRCGCSACWKHFAGEVAQCVVCKGTGKLAGRVQ